MARPSRSAAAFAAISNEGALIAPAMLAKIAAGAAGGQQAADYSVPKGLTLRDEIARYFRIGQALHAEFTASPAPSLEATIRFTETLFRQAFGFADIRPAESGRQGEHFFPLALVGLAGRAPVIVVPPADDLDRPSPHRAADDSRRSAAAAIREWLNGGDAALWGFCTNGDRLRLTRRNASLTRPAFIEAGLRQIFEDELFSDFSALWLLIQASRFGAPGTKPDESPLERWRDEGNRAGLAARERLRDGVEAALLALGNGFLADPRNAALSGFLTSGELPIADFFGQLLRLVYRLIFLFAAEDRDLLHAPGADDGAKRLYAQGYSMARLRERAVRRASWDRHDDLWQGLQVTFAALASGEERLGLPALGGLFDQAMIPSLEPARLRNRPLMQAVCRLAWLTEDQALMPVNWREMETEELGSVYEGLLELTPQLAEDGRAFRFAEPAEAKGHARKTTGSYYTPDSLVQALLESALEPVLDRVEAEAKEREAALLDVTVLDPACGSGHFLLAAARRMAARVARARSGGTFSLVQYRHALRDVVARSLHGVDRNPMAVELTKVALWIESVDPGKPLGFLGANIRCGDSLFGIFDLKALQEGIPDAAFKPLTGDAKEAARRLCRRNRDQRAGQGVLDFAAGSGRFPPPPSEPARMLRNLPEESIAESLEKERQFAAAQSDPSREAWLLASDLYVAAFLAAKSEGAPVPTTASVWQALSGKEFSPALAHRARELAATSRAFHWPLEFPDVMQRGGFDVVLGNPPWERIKLQEQEFFAARDPEIAAAPNAAARGRKIAELKEAAPGSLRRSLSEEFEAAKRLAEATSVFARESGRFPLTGRGDVNTYALFAELFSALASPRGRAGVIVPTGIATADTTKQFFASLFNAGRLASLYSFFEIRKLFLATDDRNPFCLLTIGRPKSDPEFAFSLDDISDLRDLQRRFTLSSGQIALINPNTRTAPVFRSRADAELTAKIYARVPVLIDEAKGKAGNPWGVSFARLFDMSNDSGLFRTAAELRKAGFAREGTDWYQHAARYVPLYEAKMIHQFDHRWATYDGTNARDVTAAEKADPAFEPTPRYWVPEAEVAARLAAKGWTRGWLMGWRDICRSTDERTVIATALPSAGAGNNLPLMLFGPRADPRNLAALQGSLSSVTFDYIARHKVGGTHLNFFIYEQFPALPPSSYTEPDLAFIVPRVIELTYTSHAMAPFARDSGYTGKPFAWDDERRALLRAELDAFYARKYGLSRDELRYILDPEDAMGAGYPSETFRVLKKNEIARFGEYRIARLVLQAWDRMEASGTESGGPTAGRAAFAT